MLCYFKHRTSGSVPWTRAECTHDLFQGFYWRGNAALWVSRWNWFWRTLIRSLISVNMLSCLVLGVRTLFLNTEVIIKGQYLVECSVRVYSLVVLVQKCNYLHWYYGVGTHLSLQYSSIIVFGRPFPTINLSSPQPWPITVPLIVL